MSHNFVKLLKLDSNSFLYGCLIHGSMTNSWRLENPICRDSTLQPLQIHNLAVAAHIPRCESEGGADCDMGGLCSRGQFSYFCFMILPDQKSDIWMIYDDCCQQPTPDTWHSSDFCHQHIDREKITWIWWKANKKPHIFSFSLWRFMITFYACVPYVYINLWIVTAQWHFVALHCIAISLSAQWQKCFPIPFHLGMSPSNLRAKQLIGVMVIEDWRYCLLFYHQNWRSLSWNLDIFLSFYLFLAHMLTQQIFIHKILKFCRAELIM